MKKGIRISFLVAIIVSCYALTAMAVSCSSGFQETSGICLPSNTGLPSPSGSDPLTTVILTFLQWLLAIFGVLAVLSFVISGIRYLTAYGDATAMEKGKKQITWSILGIAVGLGGYIIIQAVESILKASSSI